MKTRRSIAVSLLIVAFSVFLLYSCSSEDDAPVPDQGNTLIAEEENSLIFNDPGKLGEPSPYFYDNHFYRIEHIGVNAERRRIENLLPEPGCVILGEMHKYYLDNTDLVMYSIPGMDPEKTWIVYQSEDESQVFEVDFYPLQDGSMQFRMQTADGAHFYSLVLDPDNYLRDFQISENQAVKDFSERVYTLSAKNNSRKSVSAVCCRREADWKACMNCTIAECSKSLLCKITSFVAGPELVAAFAASCIGAGPNTWC